MIKRLKKLGAMPVVSGAGMSAGGVGGSVWSGTGSEGVVVMPWWLWTLLGAVLGVLIVGIVKNVRDAVRLAKANR
ncbi:hypothetical protein [Streptomyces fractus]|uniref:hypothetical protein n=1 Tax=Streptomyces fractus TaxID=641806 RepID=UPI003CF50B9C